VADQLESYIPFQGMSRDRACNSVGPATSECFGRATSVWSPSSPFRRIGLLQVRKTNSSTPRSTIPVELHGEMESGYQWVRTRCVRPPRCSSKKRKTPSVPPASAALRCVPPVTPPPLALAGRCDKVGSSTSNPVAWLNRAGQGDTLGAHFGWHRLGRFLMETAAERGCAPLAPLALRAPGSS